MHPYSFVGLPGALSLQPPQAAQPPSFGSPGPALPLPQQGSQGPGVAEARQAVAAAAAARAAAAEAEQAAALLRQQLVRQQVS